MRERWYDRSMEELIGMLQTDVEQGLSGKEAAARLKADGKNTINVLRKEPKHAYLRQLFSDLTTVLMLGVALLALLYRRDAGMVAILVVLFVNYALAVYSYLRAHSVFEDLGRRALPTAKVLRRGKLNVIPGEEIVMGDVIYLSYGDVVPCDARLVESQNLKVLEGNLFDVGRASYKDASFLKAGALKPSQALNMVYASTVVTGGSGKAIAVATGEDTLVCRMGKNRPIAACHRLDAVKTAKKISSVVGVLLLLPVFVLTVVELFNGGKILEALLTGLCFAVCSMCEFYAAFVQASAAQTMRNALAPGKKGGASAFLKNPLALSELRDVDVVLLPLESFRVPEGAKLTEVFDGEKIEDAVGSGSKESFLRILRYGLLSTGLYGGQRLAEKNRDRENVYTPEEEALIAACEEKNIYNRSLEDRYPILDHLGKGEKGSLFETTLVHSQGLDVVVLRGDVREVIKYCTSYSKNGKVYDMDNFARRDLLGVAMTMIKNNRTPVAVATKVSRYNNLTRIVDCQSAMTFEGILAFEKPLLPGAILEVGKLRRAGVRVIAYTLSESDENLFLAQALGIVRGDREHLCASDLPDMSEGVFRAQIEHCSLLEGFDAVQLKFAVDVLENDYKENVGFLCERLEDAYPMYAARVGFSSEDGTKLGKTGKERTLRSPLWVKRAKEGKYSCQALNHISDVILPIGDERGNGGVNSVFKALCSARMIYRNAFLILSYLFVTCGMRLCALIFGRTGDLISPLQMLLSGLVFDLLAVFVIVFERGDHSVPPRKDVLRGPGAALRALLPSLLVGAGAYLPALGWGRLMTAAGVLAEEHFASFCFIELLLLQFAALTALLRSDKMPLRDFRFSRAYGLALLFLAAFLIVSFNVDAVGELFRLTYPGRGALFSAFVLPVTALITGLAWRIVSMLLPKKKKPQKKPAEKADDPKKTK